MCFALVFDHETKRKYVDAVVDDSCAYVGGRLCSEDNEFSYLIGPEEQESGGRSTLETARKDQRDWELEYQEFRKDPEAWRAWQEKLSEACRGAT